MVLLCSAQIEIGYPFQDKILLLMRTGLNNYFLLKDKSKTSKILRGEIVQYENLIKEC